MSGNYKLQGAKHSGCLIATYTNCFKITELSTMIRV